MKKIAVVCAPGMGDALILHTVSCQLQKQGFEVATFSDHLAGFGKWLSGFRFAPQPELARIEETFAGFDAVFLQHDNSEKAQQIRALPLPVYTFYGSHIVSKHGPLREGLDFVCDPDKTMVDNIVDALETLFHFQPSKENGMRPPSGLVHRKFPKRAILHTASANAEKDWPLEKFQKTAARLTAAGFEPVFLPRFPSLEDLASFLYESGFFIGNDSGPGHLASCLGIPHWIVADDEKRMRLWRPGWSEGRLVLPPAWLPRRWRKKRWKTLITVNKLIVSIKGICAIK